MKVFFDACVLFSASKRGSLMQGLALAVLSKAKGVTNVHAVREAERNLLQKCPSWMDDFRLLTGRIPLVHQAVRVEGVDLPEKDWPILGGAIASGCTHLLTSDKRHFHKLFNSPIHGVRVVLPRTLASLLSEA